MKEWRDSLDVINKQLANNPSSTDLLLCKAAVNLQLLNWNDAIDACRKVLDNDNSNLWPGFIASPLTDDVKEQLELDKNQKGILVNSVQSKSSASVLGLRNGDVIIAVNDVKVSDLSEFYSQLSKNTGKEIWFTVLREGHEVSTMRYKKPR